jgi:hypothetical protein
LVDSEQVEFLTLVFFGWLQDIFGGSAEFRIDMVFEVFRDLTFNEKVDEGLEITLTNGFEIDEEGVETAIDDWGILWIDPLIVVGIEMEAVH